MTTCSGGPCERGEQLSRRGREAHPLCLSPSHHIARTLHHYSPLHTARHQHILLVLSTSCSYSFCSTHNTNASSSSLPPPRRVATTEARHDGHQLHGRQQKRSYQEVSPSVRFNSLYSTFSFYHVRSSRDPDSARASTRAVNSIRLVLPGFKYALLPLLPESVQRGRLCKLVNHRRRRRGGET